MTSQGPSREPRDAFEDRLEARMRHLAEGGVRPIDASAVAHAAVVQGGEQSLAARLGRARGGGAGTAARLAWLIAATALLGVLALGGTALTGGDLPAFLQGPVASAPASSGPTATSEASTPAKAADCALGDLSVRVVRWTGAAGSRIADVTVRNGGSAACSFATLDRPQLIDGHHAVLIDGAAPKTTSHITLPAGGSASTEVEDSNYCGATPVAPVSVAFVLSNGDRLIAAPVSSIDTSGVAPCNGAGAPALIQMQPWVR